MATIIITTARPLLDRRIKHSSIFFSMTCLHHYCDHSFINRLWARSRFISSYWCKPANLWSQLLSLLLSPTTTIFQYHHRRHRPLQFSNITIVVADHHNFPISLLSSPTTSIFISTTGHHKPLSLYILYITFPFVPANLQLYYILYNYLI